MLLDPQNMGLDTLIVELCALLAEIWRNIHFPELKNIQGQILGRSHNLLLKSVGGGVFWDEGVDSGRVACSC